MTTGFTPLYNENNIKPPIVSSAIVFISVVLIAVSLVLNFTRTDIDELSDGMFYTGLTICVLSLIYFGWRFLRRNQLIKHDEAGFNKWLSTEKNISLPSDNAKELYYYGSTAITNINETKKYVLDYDIDTETYEVFEEKDAFDNVDTQNITLS